jgi:hypothetical protein
LVRETEAEVDNSDSIGVDVNNLSEEFLQEAELVGTKKK